MYNNINIVFNYLSNLMLKNYDKFYFKSFSFDSNKLQAKFYYSFDNTVDFEEIIDFRNDNINPTKDINSKIINNYLFNIHLALWISYYKIYPTEELIIESWYLNKDQIKFWKKFYLNWLWEFFIKNDINPKNIIIFVNKMNKCISEDIQKSNLIDINDNELSQKKDSSKNINNSNNESLLLLWWWKDSIVSYNFIKDIDYDVFVFGKLDNIKINTSNVMWKIPLLVKRKLSKNLIKLNSLWYYNWHVPITWIIAFVSSFFCYLYDYKNIILSNEKSSNEENIIWKWIKINHQYSKSFEFEKDFSNYLKKYISNDIKYFSILRWMYEYKIAELFSKQNEFFDNFSSCNNNFKIVWKDNRLGNNKIWCCSCEKCCFVFLILSNFLNISKLIYIFWENLFLRKDLVIIFNDLIWFWKNKPFECVWTTEESLFSLNNAISTYVNEKFYILDYFKKLIANKSTSFNLKKIKNKLSKIYDEDIIPVEFKKLLKKGT